MKPNLIIPSLIAAICLGAVSLHAGTAEEKAFTDKYKTAFEASDKATLESFLYTKGADPMVLDFYRTMMTAEAGGKISKIELVDLTPDDAKKAEAIQDGPGGKMQLPLKPTKTLKIAVDKKDGESTSSSTSESFVAVKDGKFVIPVPASVK